MITTKPPVGEIINFLYKNDGFYKDESLLKEIRNLVDLIIIRADKDGIDETLKSLESNLFKLRFKIINEFQSFQDITGTLNNSIQDRIRLQFNQSTNQKKLELAFVNSINIYGKIAENIRDKISEEPFVSIKPLPQLKYEDFVDLLKSLSGKESQFIISYISSSISLDYALIVTELVFDDQLKLKKTEIDKLILLLKNSTEEYAVFSNKFGFWTPADDDESQWIRNIKIRISLFESKFLSDHLSSNDINEMLVA